MSDTKHTPGPWEVEHGALGNIWWVEDADGETVCDLYHRVNDGHDENSFHLKRNAEANARLIAAAPELLEALEWAAKELRETLSPGIKCSVTYRLEEINTVLAKAKGEDQ